MTTDNGGYQAGACEVCGDPNPPWRLERRGDAVVTWACHTHLARAVAGLQRDHEITEVVVKDRRKMQEWAGIARQLDAIAQEADRG